MTDRVCGFVAVVAVMVRDLVANPGEIDLRTNSAQGVIRPDSLLEIHLVSEELRLIDLYTHHNKMDRAYSMPTVLPDHLHHGRFGQQPPIRTLPKNRSVNPRCAMLV